MGTVVQQSRLSLEQVRLRGWFLASEHRRSVRSLWQRESERVEGVHPWLPHHSMTPVSRRLAGPHSCSYTYPPLPVWLRSDKNPYSGFHVVPPFFTIKMQYRTDIPGKSGSFKNVVRALTPSSLPFLLKYRQNFVKTRQRLHRGPQIWGPSAWRGPSPLNWPQHTLHQWFLIDHSGLQKVLLRAGSTPSPTPTQPLWELWKARGDVPAGWPAWEGTEKVKL